MTMSNKIISSFIDDYMSTSFDIPDLSIAKSRVCDLLYIYDFIR